MPAENMAREMLLRLIAGYLHGRDTRLFGTALGKERLGGVVRTTVQLASPNCSKEKNNMMIPCPKTARFSGNRTCS